MMKLFSRLPRAFAEGWLSAMDGHEIFYHQFGNPNGVPVVSFHGGPGSRSSAKYADRWFNLKTHRVILFDQRGCGRTRSVDPIRNNTPDAAIDDAMRILNACGIAGKIISAGASYGSTLALLFAEKFPARVRQICVGSIFLARKRDVQDWMEHDARRFWPDMLEEMDRVAKGRPLTKYFAGLLFSGKRADERIALKYYGNLEDNVGSLTPGFALPPPEDYERALRSFKVSMHFISNGFFMTDGRVLKDAKKIAKIPAIIAHNRLDLCCPFEQAWSLHKALPKSALHIVPDIGHGGEKLNAAVKKAMGE
ncbi:MAG: alpha/beta fold hydrolase [Rickettsiales bacterium]|jgi:proline iminopeptidase|nr:alpha/beta fold hydrolase [Rickettsiales bacterium]